MTTAEALGDVLRGLRRLPPPRPELAYGGWIFNARPELRAQTPGVYLGADARAAIATVEQLLGGGQRTTPPPRSDAVMCINDAYTMQIMYN